MGSILPSQSGSRASFGRRSVCSIVNEEEDAGQPTDETASVEDACGTIETFFENYSS